MLATIDNAGLTLAVTDLDHWLETRVPAIIGPYSRMWNDDMGWITNASGHILMRFDQPADREAFRRDLRGHPERLIHPLGMNSSLRVAIKNIAVSGSLPSAKWDDSLVGRVMSLGLPIFFLPHVIKEPLIASNPLDFK